MLDRGAFTGVHAAAMVHPGPVDVARAEPYAVSHSHIAYDGKAAHARHTPTVESTPPTPSPSPRLPSAYYANNSRLTSGCTA
jgi:hypothetical protein